MAYEEHRLFIKEENLENYAETVARAMKVTGRSSGRTAAAAVRRALRDIDRAHDALALKWQNLASMPGAVRWLLDNLYLAKREGAVAAEALAGGGALRAAGREPLLLALCRELANSGGWALDDRRLELFLAGFQRFCVLSRTELFLLPAGLRAALLLRLAEKSRELAEAGDYPGAETEFAHLFTSLRTLSSCDLGKLIENADFVERCYRADPAGIYPAMDEASREHYRLLTARLARRRGVSEYQAARLVLSLAQHGSGLQSHVGYWLLREPLGSRPFSRHGGLYMGTNILLTLFLSLLGAFATGSAAAFFLLLLPVSDLVKSLLDFTLLRLIPCAWLPRLALEEGVPGQGRTLCVVSCLLTGEQDGPALAARLEEYRLCSRDCGDNLLFALLADLPDTKTEELPGADAWLAAAGDAIEELNRRYGGGFLLLTRPRTRNAEGRFMGWERKRGALLETMRFLRGRESGIRLAAGSGQDIRDIRYLLTLDSDTRLTPEAAREMIGAALHPLNRPQVDEKRRLVTAGHGILTPRMSVELASAGKSDFSRLFAPQGGADPYSGPCGEVYMDCWGSGGFTGKGLIHIDSYLLCMDQRIPENRVLSHDALEGAFLRGGYLGATELMDAFPATPLSYFKRLHRWVRGDWQNLPWLFRRGRELPSIERFRLLDSLRRPLVPVMTLASLCAAFLFPSPGTVTAAVAALLSCACGLIIGACQSLFRSTEESSRRFYSRVFYGVGGGLVQTMLRLILLPVEAFFCLDAMLRALWRMFVSKKKLLQWQTAGQSDALKSGPLRCYAAMWPAAGLGLLLLLAGGILGRAAGLLWLLSPLCAYLLGVPRDAPRPLSPADQDYLAACARDIWSYFDQFLTPEDNFLPPDNYQARPAVGLAHRSSPTNIGMALLSITAAHDLGLAEKERCLDLLEHCLDTLERLPKWQGHLYNWYDTRTLLPLSPRYVSTVDSGNFYACLAACSTALTEFGRPDLAARAEALLADMCFTPLYDEKRQLFHIGLDTDSGELTPSWYDLLSSEARLTAYLAVAKGDVPRRHWRRLSRAQVQKNGYRGMASWTGTMFEYLMPELLLPLYKDSLLYESARFCLYVQKQRTAPLGKPWGISESAFYSLDPSMSYRYKAHGCAALALKPGMDRELVLSPYSSFLALGLQPREALGNLRRLEALGLREEFGFWEAVDFTPSRCPKSGGVVRCVMSHHLGMSLAAIDNCLCENILCRRFMARGEMRAYALLLQEKLPLGGVVLHRKNADAPVKPPRDFGGGWSRSGEDTAFLQPASCLLSSQIYSLMLTESGLSRPLWGSLSPYLPAKDPVAGHHGLDVFLRLAGEELSLLPEPQETQESGRSWEFSGEHACLRLRRGPLSAGVSAWLPREDAGEVRLVSLQWEGEALDGELALRFTPLLAAESDYVNHPAFYKMGLSLSLRDRCLLVHRLPRGRLPELWLALACDRPCVFANVPGLDSGRSVPEREIGGEEEYFLTEPLTECRVPLRLAPGETLLCTFALGMGHSPEGALLSARRALDGSERADLPQRAAAVLGMDSQALGRAWALLPRLAFPSAPAPGPHRQEELWKFGISGDLPILCAEYEHAGQLEAARALMDCHLLLGGCGFDFDLVFISHDGASYHKPLNSALSELLWHNGGDLLSGAKGGVHILEDADGAAGVRACAALTLDLNDPWHPVFRDTAYRAPLLPSRPRTVPDWDGPVRWDEENRVLFPAGPQLPPRMWSNLLTNGRLGYLAADCGGGNLWFLNARENPLSPWLCQPLASTGPEALFVRCGREWASAFGEPGGGQCLLRFAPGTAEWDKQVFSGTLRTRAFIPPDTDARVFLIDCRDLPQGAMLHWRMDLQLSPRREDARYVCTAEKDGLLLARSDRAMAQALPLTALSCPPPAGFTCRKASALAGKYDSQSGWADQAVFALTFPAAGRVVLVCGCGEESALRALADPDAAEAAWQRTQAYWKAALPLRLRSEEPALDRLMNGWLGYQALACRVLGRCSIYQSGGAYGFRDQLQDCVNLLLFDSAPAREQILRSCRHQYREGDVQHWWHEGGSEPRGVRTRCSDDLLWLPWSLCEYVEKTGDRALCGELCAYLVSPELKSGEHDRYEAAVSGVEQESVLSHCCRALDMVLRRGTGERGLLRIGAGDWNDGLDKVGGESQWLTWFFCLTAQRFAALLDSFFPGRGETYRAAAEKLLAAAEDAWDGAWYLRGSFAGGTPLGSRESPCCRIDSLAQSFAALCPGADPARVDQALDSALAQLFDRKHGLVKLFTPPFDGRGPDPGYIAAYGPGFRENGGQYTHGALWLVLALLRRERVDEAWEVLRCLLPADKDISRYRGEPYVLAADVYTAPGHVGEAGWTWYTGSAGWMLRIVTEELLGLRLRDGLLYIRPRLPSHWTGFELRFRDHTIVLENGRITVDGQDYSGGGLDLFK